MKITITENDIRKMVRMALNEVAFGYSDDKSSFEMPDNEDINMVSEDLREKLVNKFSLELVRDIQNYISKKKEEEDGIIAWIDRKKITDPVMRQKIFTKLLDRKIFHFPWVLERIQDNNKVYISDPDSERPRLCYDSPHFGGWHRENENDGPKMSEEELLEKYSDLNNCKEYFNQVFDNTLEIENQRRNKSNQEKRELIAQSKQQFPECFDGSMDRMSYLEIRDLLQRLYYATKGRGYFERKSKPDNPYLLKLEERVCDIGEEMEKGAEKINLDWANGWKEGGKEYQIKDELEEMEKDGRAIYGCCTPVFGYAYTVLDKNKMPIKIYSWQVDSSD